MNEINGYSLYCKWLIHTFVAMLTEIHPKLPMRNLQLTKSFYIDQLGFEPVNEIDFDAYLMMKKDHIQLHFFEFKDLNPLENYGQVYIRTNNIDDFYQTLLLRHVAIHPHGALSIKPWGQKEFSILDPDHNLLTFGEQIV